MSLPNPEDYDSIEIRVVSLTDTVTWNPRLQFDAIPIRGSLGSTQHDGSGDSICDEGRPNTGMLYPRG